MFLIESSNLESLHSFSVFFINTILWNVYSTELLSLDISSRVMKSLSEKPFWKYYGPRIMVWTLVVAVIIVSLYHGIDEKIVVFVTIVLGIFTQIFAGLGALIAMIPFFGPLIVKVITIPIFYLLNAMGWVVSGVAIKKGYANELAKSRTVTLAVLIGIILGYILGHAVPIEK